MIRGEAGRLQRVVGIPGAVLMGLGSILGTGIFVSIGIAAGIAGPSVILAVVIAAAVATFNGLSSAQLAASHPVSGGTYEYGYRYLSPAFGFTAGWMFLVAKSASAATAALGFAGYVLHAYGYTGVTIRIVLAVAIVALLTIVVAGGMRRSNRSNAVIVSLTVAVLLLFVAAVFPAAFDGASVHLAAFFDGQDTGLRGLLHATALMFVAYTGYGRIATLGEEIRNPRRNIPAAIIITLIVSMLLYAAVAFVAVSAVGASALAEATRSAAAPLEAVVQQLGLPGIAWVVTIGAVTAMLGVLLSQILGISRMLFALARRRDLPPTLAHVHPVYGVPDRGILLTGLAAVMIALFGTLQAIVAAATSSS